MRNKLLIVDDEPMIYHALRRGLHRESDWETLYAGEANAALEMLGSQDIDIVLCDENMPGMNGSQLLSLVRQRWPEVIRMMLTGDARVDVVMNAINNGEIYRFFTKPCNEAELIVALRDALQMKRLKAESRRLLDVVKIQAARIRMLEGGKGGTLSDVPNVSSETSGMGGGCMGGATNSSMSSGDEPRSLSLDDLTARREGGAREGMESCAATSGSEAIDLSGDDVDSLLAAIRAELDDVAR